MTSKAKDTLGEWAPHIAIMITIVGAAWALGGKLSSLETKVEQNAAAIERNAAAIERNAAAIERNAQAIAKTHEALATLTGQYVEHVRFHNEVLASR